MSSSVEIADRVSRRRAIGVGIAAVIFLLVQIAARPVFLSAPQTMSLSRAVVWGVNAILLLLLLFTGGGLAYKREIRALVNDEVSRNNYHSAITLAYWIAMIIAMTLYALAGGYHFTSRETVYLIVTPSVGLALITFSLLELRAHRDG